MRKRPGIHIIGSLVRMGCMWLPLCATLSAQDSTQAEPKGTTSAATDPLHADPAAFVSRAGKLNGVRFLPNWHLRATFRLLDDSGRVKDTGVFEEYQAGPTKFRLSYTSGGFTGMTFATAREDEAIFRSGAQTPPPWPISELFPSFIDPLPRENVLASVNFEPVTIPGAGAAVSCLKGTDKSIVGSGNSPRILGIYCFDTGKTDLRYSYILAAPTLAVGRGVAHITSFQGKTIPTDLEIRKGATLVMTAHLETIEALPQLDEALFVPPADAKLYPTKMASPEILAMIAQVPHDIKTASNAGTAPNVPKANGAEPMRVTLLPGSAESLLIQKTPPVYPPVAKAARVSGIVVLQAVISTTGEVTDVQVVSGPPLLQGAAVDAVKTWRYRPFLLNGKPATVQTTINVVFTLGG